jgi:hypothetical protein
MATLTEITFEETNSFEAEPGSDPVNFSDFVGLTGTANALGCGSGRDITRWVQRGRERGRVRRSGGNSAGSWNEGYRGRSGRPY